VNQVWNAVNEISEEFGCVPIPGVGYVDCETSEFDLINELRDLRLGRGFSIGAATAQSVISQHAKSRKQFRKAKLNWRVSKGSRRALGWVPFKAAGIKYEAGRVRFCGQYFKVWDSYGLSGYELGTGSFSEDSRGRWYFNVTVKEKIKMAGLKSFRLVEEVNGVNEIKEIKQRNILKDLKALKLLKVVVEKIGIKKEKAIGIDLGLARVATCSNGLILDRQRFTLNYSHRLAMAQRAKKKRQVTAIHAKIKNARKDYLHKFTNQLVNQYGKIFVGDVSSQWAMTTNKCFNHFITVFFNSPNMIKMREVFSLISTEVVLQMQIFSVYVLLPHRICKSTR
jgi:hypothetical protein